MVRALMVLALAFAATEAAAASPEPGKRLFVQCGGCHAVERGQTNPIGPNLAGVVGRKAAADKAFAYSPALRGAKIIWSPKTLDAFLADPQKVVPHTSMAYFGLKKPADRQAVIAYLKSRS